VSSSLEREHEEPVSDDRGTSPGADPRRAGAGRFGMRALTAPFAAFTASESGMLARFSRPVAGLGIAASVAALSVLWLQARTQSLAPGAVVGPTSAVVVAASGSPSPSAVAGAEFEIVVAPPSAVATGWDAASARTATEPRSYVVPLPSSRPMALSAPQLANYVVAHSEFSGPMSRRSTLSALVATDNGSDGGPELQSESAPQSSPQSVAERATGTPPARPSPSPLEVTDATAP
jgi:hypothetical protein